MSGVDPYEDLPPDYRPPSPWALVVAIVCLAVSVTCLALVVGA